MAPRAFLLCTGRAYRLESGGRLYYYYARLLLNSYPLKSSSLDNEILAPIYAESYSSASKFP